MNELNNYLAKIEKKIGSSLFLNKQIKEIIVDQLDVEEEFGIEIKGKKIEIKTNNFYFKNEVFIKKDFILEKIKKETNKVFKEIS